MSDAQENKPEGQSNNLELQGSRQFASWLYDEGITLAFSTYQAGKLFFIGTNPEPDEAGKKLYIFNRTINRCMGLCAADLELYVSSLYQIYRFRASGENTDLPCFIPQVSYFTGDIDAHDMAREDSGRLVFAATLFNCVATVDENFSFRPIWKPPFINKLVPEDRCHLNGLGLRDGRARYITAVSKSNIVDGWREHRQGGGIVMDMAANSKRSLFVRAFYGAWPCIRITPLWASPKNAASGPFRDCRSRIVWIKKGCLRAVRCW